MHSSCQPALSNQRLNARSVRPTFGVATCRLVALIALFLVDLSVPLRAIAAVPVTDAAQPVSTAQAPAVSAAVDDDLPRHALELKALVEPDAVLTELQPLLAAAEAKGDMALLSLLYLAQANACRVVADWTCQQEAGARAAFAGKAAGKPILQTRGLIAESRGRIARRDFARGENLLGEAELLLATNPSPQLAADVFLAYSSLSYLLGKYELSEQYARKGLDVLDGSLGAPMQARLLRNLARAQNRLGEGEAAMASLILAHDLVQQIDDPKLEAEIHLEEARLAANMGDVASQRASGMEVLRLANQLKNSQLSGLGEEILGMADLADGKFLEGQHRLEVARDSFHQLGQDRDEMRSLRALLTSYLAQDATRETLLPTLSRYLELERLLNETDLALASDDFDARLKYAQQQTDLMRLEGEAALQQQRAQTLAATHQVTVVLASAAAVVSLVLAALFYLMWRSRTSMQRVLHRLEKSESRYRILAENSRDLVVQLDANGKRLYVSPSAQDMLGWSPKQMLGDNWDFVHPDEYHAVINAIRDLGRAGGTATITCRVMHRDGHYVWIEALARRVRSTTPDALHQIVYSGRDVTERVAANRALKESESRLSAVTENMPALIAHVDGDERYRFVNRYMERLFQVEPGSLNGKTQQEVLDQETLALLRPHVDAVMQGKPQQFEVKRPVGLFVRYFRCSFVPDIDDDGNVNGFYSLSLDITGLKEAEKELKRLARVDSLSGIANRRHFDELIAHACAQSHRQTKPIAVMLADIDHFKQINDSRGHAVGDEVIREFADRLKHAVRESDVVARLGGDEFAVLIEDARSLDACEAVADKLLELTRKPFVINGQPLSITTSIGIGFMSHSNDPDALMALADRALYSAKDAGRDLFHSLLGEPESSAHSRRPTPSD